MGFKGIAFFIKKIVLDFHLGETFPPKQIKCSNFFVLYMSVNKCAVLYFLFIYLQFCLFYCKCIAGYKIQKRLVRRWI